MAVNGRQYMHHDARGECGPYTAMHAEGPWYCMVPEGVEVPPDSPVLRANGPIEIPTSVGWASDKSLRAGLRPGLHGDIGWVPVA